MKIIKNIAAFIIVLLVLVYAIQYSVDLVYKKRVRQKFTQILNHKIDRDIMIFGSSIAYHNLDPAVIKNVTGLPIYNMGWDGVFFVQYNSLIKEYLGYETKCKCIVVACDFDNLGKNVLITRPDLFYAYLGNNNVYRSLHAIEPQKTFMARYLPGYKLTLLNKSFYNDILFTSVNEQDSLGYQPINKNFEPIKSFKPFSARCDTEILLSFKKQVDEIVSKGIKVVIVMTPVYDSGYRLILNADFIKNKYRSLRGKSVFYLDYTQDSSLCYDKDNFMNYSHLNQAGAAKFSNRFAQDLLKVMQ